MENNYSKCIVIQLSEVIAVRDYLKHVQSGSERVFFIIYKRTQVTVGFLRSFSQTYDKPPRPGFVSDVRQ